MKLYEEKAESPARTSSHGRSFWSWHLFIAVFLSVSGMALLFLGFWLPPEGEIHSSVLVGFGEVSTFAGALFGVDYRYKIKTHSESSNL